MTWSPVIFELHDSFINADSTGCATQRNRQVPPDENNFSRAHHSLLRRLRPVKYETRAAEFPLSFPSHAFRFDLKYSINSTFEPVTRIFILRRTYSKLREKNISQPGNYIFQDHGLVHVERTSIGVG